MKLQALLEDRRQLLAIQQRLIDDIKGGELDVKLGKHYSKPCIEIYAPRIDMRLHVVIEREGDGWQMYSYDKRDCWDVDALTGDSSTVDIDEIVAEVQSYTFGPQP